MDTAELTAKYICDDQERLQMALHVYEAMQAVRECLMQRIFEAVGERIAEQIDGVEWNPYPDSVEFYTKKTGEWRVSAWLSHGSRGYTRTLVAGLYVNDAKLVNKTERNEIQRQFDVDRETWSYGDSFSSNTEVSAYVDSGGRKWRWDRPDFLKRAILNQDDVVSDIAELLVRIYEDIFVSQ